MRPHAALISVRSFSAAVLSAALAGGCSAESSTGAVSFPEEPLLTTLSASGSTALEVRTAPEQPPARGMSEVELTLTDAAQQRVPDVALDVVTWMPAMGHGASVKPSVVALGDGRYVVSDVELFMPGRWELRIQIDGSVSDAAIVNLDVR